MELLKELHILLTNHRAWGGGTLSDSDDVMSSGFSQLDDALPQGGWSRAGVIGIQIPREGAGELSVLLPALAQHAREHRKVVFVAPPYLPYAPSLASAGVDLSLYMLVKVQSLESRLWAIEQALRSGASGAVVFWAQGMNAYHLRRLHRAALEGNAMGFAFHHPEWDLSFTDAIPLSLAMQPAQGAKVEVVIYKGKQQSESVSFTLDLPRDNPILSTPLPPSRGRVAHIPAWKPRASPRFTPRTPETSEHPWMLHGNVA
jgi:protein ImuA